jgi:uncharacterized protein YcbX
MTGSGRTVAIGGTVRLAITEPCPRCVMITLPQETYAKTQESSARLLNTTE